MSSKCRIDLARKCQDGEGAQTSDDSLTEGNGSNTQDSGDSPVVDTDDGDDSQDSQQKECFWMEGKKAVGTATASALSCQSKICSGEIVCRENGKYYSEFITCLATDDNQCPSVEQCMGESIVKDLKKGIEYDYSNGQDQGNDSSAIEN